MEEGDSTCLSHRTQNEAKGSQTGEQWPTLPGSVPSAEVKAGLEQEGLQFSDSAASHAHVPAVGGDPCYQAPAGSWAQQKEVRDPLLYQAVRVLLQSPKPLSHPTPTPTAPTSLLWRGGGTAHLWETWGTSLLTSNGRHSPHLGDVKGSQLWAVERAPSTAGASKAPLYVSGRLRLTSALMMPRGAPAPSGNGLRKCDSSTVEGPYPLQTPQKRNNPRHTSGRIRDITKQRAATPPGRGRVGTAGRSPPSPTPRGRVPADAALQAT